jgi:hypothetical protein
MARVKSPLQNNDFQQPVKPRSTSTQEQRRSGWRTVYIPPIANAARWMGHLFCFACPKQEQGQEQIPFGDDNKKDKNKRNRTRTKAKAMGTQ